MGYAAASHQGAEEANLCTTFGDFLYRPFCSCEGGKEIFPKLSLRLFDGKEVGAALWDWSADQLNVFLEYSLFSWTFLWAHIFWGVGSWGRG